MTKKNVAKTLEERMVEAFRMGYNCGVAIHPEIDALQGEVRVPRELSGQWFRSDPTSPLSNKRLLVLVLISRRL